MLVNGVTRNLRGTWNIWARMLAIIASVLVISDIFSISSNCSLKQMNWFWSECSVCFHFILSLNYFLAFLTSIMILLLFCHVLIWYSLPYWICSARARYLVMWMFIIMHYTFMYRNNCLYWGEMFWKKKGPFSEWGGSVIRKGRSH
jgi:hypothetical protein